MAGEAAPSLTLLEKLQPAILLSSIAIGLAASQLVPTFAETSSKLITPALLGLLYSIFLMVPVGRIASALRDRRSIGLALAVNFVFIPILAWALGAVFLGDHPALWVGLIMYLVTPCTDWYLIFTNLARGNVPLGVALLPWNLVLQILLLPFYLLIFAGRLVPIDISVLAGSVLLFFVMPFSLAVLSRRAMRTWRRAGLERSLSSTMPMVQLAFLTLAIFAIFASQGGAAIENLDLLALVLLPILSYFGIIFLTAQSLGRAAGLGYGERTLLTFTTSARNSPVSLAIAVSAFPESPLIAMVVAIGPVIELPILLLIAKYLPRLG